MPAYVLSPDALQDLQEVWDFIAADDATAADKLEMSSSRCSSSWVIVRGWAIRELI